jgi:4'-phosphopantetheinyl transferase
MISEFASVSPAAVPFRLENLAAPGPLSTMAVSSLIVASTTAMIEEMLAEAYLAEGERARAAEILHLPRRAEYRAGRMLLRHAVWRVTGLEPPGIMIEAKPSGQVFVWNGPRVSISHSGGIVVAAVSTDHALGVDIEESASESRLRRLLPALFPALSEAIDAAPETESRIARLTVWTRREAVLKAAGVGLAGRIAAVEIMAEAAGAATVEARFAGVTWQIADFTLPGGAIGSIAYRLVDRDVV